MNQKELDRILALDPPEGVKVIIVLHDNWCDKLKDGSECNCDPEYHMYGDEDFEGTGDGKEVN